LFNNSVDVPVITISHHLAHAYNAIGTRPFSEAAILVINGCGSLYDECIDLANAIVPEKIDPKLTHLYAEKDSFYNFLIITLL
jgi:carbamoyltransferase